MAIYIGNNRVKLNINGEKVKLNLFNFNLNPNISLLKTADNLILKDIHGLYLTTKENN